MIGRNQLHLRRRANQRLAVLASKKLNSVCRANTFLLKLLEKLNE